MSERSAVNRLETAEARELAANGEIGGLAARARALTLEGHGRVVGYSRKVFIPLTMLCRDVCHYCTFAKPPRALAEPYMTIAEAVELARSGAARGCKEALLTLGDRPEARYRVAREWLAAQGFATTLDYVAEVARAIIEETGLLPHVNAGLIGEADLVRLRAVSPSMGLMLESAAARLCLPGGAHHGSPDKRPAERLAAIAAAGRVGVPFTSGILIGIGETRAERIEALLALRDLNDAHGHIQEIIVQNFRAKLGTRMALAPEPPIEELLWTVAAARLIFGGAMTIQAPPNLSAGGLAALIAAGVNDWGGVSPLTPDHVNPEAPWPEIERLEQETSDAGGVLVERTTVHPRYVRGFARWIESPLQPRLLALTDAEGFAREDDWVSGGPSAPPARDLAWLRRPADEDADPMIADALERAEAGLVLHEGEIVGLFGARGSDFAAVCKTADRMRRAANGDIVSYVVNRNINYTNICGYRCGFCAFSKGRTSDALRGKPYLLELEEVGRRAAEAWARGATEVCMQGGIHPAYTGQTYLDLCSTVKAAAPGIHIHAFSPLEVWHGSATLGLPVEAFLEQLRQAGLSTLPGTAAEILDDEVRAVLCPDKLSTAQWLEVMASAHRIGIRTTATIMFGHVDRTDHWARHLLRVRHLQEAWGGITEFVPLPFVAEQTPIYLKGRARRGPTFREGVLMHAVSRIVLHGAIDNIQASWVKLGPEGAAACLDAGVNDLGGVLMNESITRAAGASHGQELSAAKLQTLIRAAGRLPRQRTTNYADAPIERIRAARDAAPLAPPGYEAPPRNMRGRAWCRQKDLRV